MNRITYYVGLGHEFNPNTIDSAQLLVKAEFGGLTWLSGAGIWHNEFEPAAVVMVYAEPLAFTYDTSARYERVAQSLRRLFNQTEVWYTVDDVSMHVAARPAVKAVAA